LKRKKQQIKEEGPKVPAYIVTFSDMTTLLLTFFVMLLSLASVQDQALFRTGRDSFRFSLDSLGLGMLLGREQKPDLGNLKIRYSIIDPDKLSKDRSINTKEEKIRKIFNELQKSMTAMPSEIAPEKNDFTVTNIRFARGDARLDESAKQFLGGFYSQLQQNYGSRLVKLYVLGLAADQTGEKEKWILSAMRAKAVADYLQGIISSGPGFQAQRGTSNKWSNWSVYWWGAGPGGDWVRQDSLISKQSQILIAVVRVDE
jgi:chemotaxis protein MotB